MIIECGNCGAPLDVKEKARSVKCSYCGTPNQVRSGRTVAFQTPPGWRPPTQWTPPPHVAADSSQVLTYHAAKGAGSAALIISAVISIAVLGGIAAVVIGVQSTVSSTTRQTIEITRQVNDATRSADDALKQALAQASAAQERAGLKPVPGAGPGGAQLSFLTAAGVKQALDSYKKALGVKALRATELTFHDNHSSIEVQSPKNPKHVDGYRLINGAVMGPDAVRLHGSEKRNLKAHLFDPDKTALSKLEELKRTALGKLAYEQAKITHIIVDRGRGKTTIRIYGSSPRDSGYVRFDENGKFVRAYR